MGPTDPSQRGIETKVDPSSSDYDVVANTPKGVEVVGVLVVGTGAIQFDGGDILSGVPAYTLLPIIPKLINSAGTTTTDVRILYN